MNNTDSLRGLAFELEGVIADCDADGGPGFDGVCLATIIRVRDALLTTADAQGRKFVVVPRELTAENGAKAALIGEFAEEVDVPCGDCGGSNSDCDACDGEGTVPQVVPISWDMIKQIHRRMVAHFAAAPAVQGRSVGDWLWAQLMDWCKSQRIAPATQDGLFAMVERARKEFDDAPAAQVADEGALEHWDSILSDAEEIASNARDDRIKYRAERVAGYLRGHKPGAAPAAEVDEATRLFDAGWYACADLADRDDLPHDIGSPFYEKKLAAALGREGGK